MNDELKSKVEKYLKNARDMFENLDIRNVEELNIEKISEEFKTMALSYYKDAIHFYDNEEYVNALASLEYAEGWLDAGKVLGIFKVN